MDAREQEDLEQALSDRDFWAELAPKGWTVGGFTYRNSVTYHKIEDGNYALSASFEYGQVAFLRQLIEELKNDR